MGNPQTKDDALEALDFIVNVLKEHEKELDKLINELATVTEQIGDTGQLSGKVEKVEEKIDTLQKEVTNLITYLSSNTPKEANPTIQKDQPSQPTQIAQTPQTAAAAVVQSGPPIILRCKQWEDFQNLAAQAQTLSFNCKEEEKTLQADALKGNKIITYTGSLPKQSIILKTWLSKQLNTPENNIVEGILTTT